MKHVNRQVMLDVLERIREINNKRFLPLLDTEMPNMTRKTEKENAAYYFI